MSASSSSARSGWPARRAARRWRRSSRCSGRGERVAERAEHDAGLLDRGPDARVAERLELALALVEIARAEPGGLARMARQLGHARLERADDVDERVDRDQLRSGLGVAAVAVELAPVPHAGREVPDRHAEPLAHLEDDRAHGL